MAQAKELCKQRQNTKETYSWGESVQPKKSSLKFKRRSKLEAKYCGHLKILNRIEHVAYMLELLTTIEFHNLFHMSFLKYVYDLNHVVD